MKIERLLLLVFVVLAQSCSIAYGDSYDHLRLINSGRAELAIGDELESLKKIRGKTHQLVLASASPETVDQRGRFQIHRADGVTWRFDTSTGDICPLLASKADWERLKTSPCEP